MSDQIKSASITLTPADKRCRYWAKIVRAETALPLPSAAEGANDIPAAYARKGAEELFPGDILIEGEENHHRNARGWSYWVTYCDSEGIARRIRNPGADEKAAMKAAGLPSELLAGSGGVAAAVRFGHGVRLGLIAADPI
jgi:hypothetical protein